MGPSKSFCFVTNEYGTLEVAAGRNKQTCFRRLSAG